MLFDFISLYSDNGSAPKAPAVQRSLAFNKPRPATAAAGSNQSAVYGEKLAAFGHGGIKSAAFGSNASAAFSSNTSAAFNSNISATMNKPTATAASSSSLTDQQRKQIDDNRKAALAKKKSPVKGT